MIEILQQEFKQLNSGFKENDVFSQLEAEMNKESVNLEKKIPALERRLERIQKQKNKAMDFHMDGNTTKEEYHLYIESKRNKECKIQDEIVSIKETFSTDDDIEGLKLIKSLLIDLLSFEKLTSDILNRFIEKIEIKAERSPRIHYRFSDTPALYLLNSRNAQHST
ncbi:hypothetical protein [Sporosarcina limicola]|uniref:DUF4368 domain-containing protein n=1 Tax=Sporosarcina limicola TaxID=34101 RepID=A0A927MR83_9BACL|nr:hypothetical protein [Sporosarcina limicola]MBE1556014.1 hypothetical protein [Sporosarcina limicola]